MPLSKEGAKVVFVYYDHFKDAFDLIKQHIEDINQQIRTNTAIIIESSALPYYRPFRFELDDLTNSHLVRTAVHTLHAHLKVIDDSTWERYNTIYNLAPKRKVPPAADEVWGQNEISVYLDKDALRDSENVAQYIIGNDLPVGNVLVKGKYIAHKVILNISVIHVAELLGWRHEEFKFIDLSMFED